MQFFEELETWFAGAASDFQELPFVKKTLNGDLSKKTYISLLKEYYFFVKSASPMYAKAGAAIKGEYPEAKEWFYKQAYHHLSHHTFIENDLLHFGQAKSLQNHIPSPEVDALCSYNIGFIQRHNGLGVLGTPYVMTQISSSLALNVVDKLKLALELDESEDGVSFFFAHGHLDKRQPEEIAEIIKTITNPEIQKSILLNAKTLLFLYRAFLNSFA